MSELIEENKSSATSASSTDSAVGEEMPETIRKAPELSWYSRFLINIVRTGKVPKSVAFIMDGNRRFATKNNKQKHAGHKHGLAKLEETMLWCKGLGITEMTVFALAKDNLKRSQVEVDTLMGLCKNQFQRLAHNNGVFMKEKIKIRVLGDLTLIPEDVRQSLRKTEEMTRLNDQATLNVCICYSGTDELDQAISTEPADVSQFDSQLQGGYNVKPAILIRTSGEIRLSNFLLH